MKSYIDYIYYRISKLYYKYDGRSGIHAMLILSLTEGLLIIELFVLLSRFLFTTQQIQNSKFIGYLIVLISMLPFLIINYVKYVKPKWKYDLFDNRWENESKSKRVLKGFLIFISLLLPWLLLFPLNDYLQRLI